MKDLESSKHLYQQPKYKTTNNVWTDSYRKALDSCGVEVRLDVTAIASVISFGMVGQDRTLIKEIKRQPWMSSIDKDNKVIVEVPPRHRTIWASDEIIADHLFDLLCNEAASVCEGFSEICLLLSGGMDSRIIAGVLMHLYHTGEIQSKPFAVTWGLHDSRDVVYAKNIASTLGMDWRNIEYGPETVLKNINYTVHELGLLHSPEMLHYMTWFKKYSSSVLVIAGSFGDSIGRAEFAGLHLLQLEKKQPINSYQLLKPNVFNAAKIGLKQDLDEIHMRGGCNVPSYVSNEYWMQGFRMRGGLCHALSIINNYANIYQMFTAPEVYKTMWSLHPARRDDEIYKALLERKLKKIARIPWPRTNRSLDGIKKGAVKCLRPQYHEYTKWCSGPLYQELRKRVEPEWFLETGLFSYNSINNINNLVRTSNVRVGRINDIWLWLAGFRAFIEDLENKNKKIVFELDYDYDSLRYAKNNNKLFNAGVLLAGKYVVINNALKNVRGYKRKIELGYLKKKSKLKYPPNPQ
jgi:asparagine synthase (glutamine-hydrolysing)